MRWTGKNLYLLIEQIVLYLGVPLAIYLYAKDLRTYAMGGSFLIFLLPGLALILLVWMAINKTFYNVRFIYTENFWFHFKQILIFFIPSLFFWSGITYFLEPDLLFYLPRENFSTWLLIMFAYPLFSVLPQGILFRVFFFYRYKFLYKKTLYLIIASGLFFCYAHIIFHNLYALLFTFLGGMLFAYRYYKTKSWLISSLEHAMYGNMLFTIGLGKYLIAGIA